MWNPRKWHISRSVLDHFVSAQHPCRILWDMGNQRNVSTTPGTSHQCGRLHTLNRTTSGAPFYTQLLWSPSGVTAVLGFSRRVVDIVSSTHDTMQTVLASHPGCHEKRLRLPGTLRSNKEGWSRWVYSEISKPGAFPTNRPL